MNRKVRTYYYLANDHHLCFGILKCAGIGTVETDDEHGNRREIKNNNVNVQLWYGGK
jgi:hypothetical protein